MTPELTAAVGAVLVSLLVLAVLRAYTWHRIHRELRSGDPARVKHAQEVTELMRRKHGDN